VVAPPVVAAPAAAVAAAPVVNRSPPRVAPWVLAGGAAVAATAGGILWWDGSRRAHDLDLRFSSGDLTLADLPSYSRARNESLAGRLLVLAAAGLLGGAVFLWW